MELNLLKKEKVKAYDTTKAMEIIRKKYPRAKLITYSFEPKMKDLPKSKRIYKNRIMWVWFVKDSDLVKEVI